MLIFVLMTLNLAQFRMFPHHSPSQKIQILNKSADRNEKAKTLTCLTLNFLKPVKRVRKKYKLQQNKGNSSREYGVELPEVEVGEGLEVAQVGGQ